MKSGKFEFYAVFILYIFAMNFVVINITVKNRLYVCFKFNYAELSIFWPIKLNALTFEISYVSVSVCMCIFVCVCTKACGSSETIGLV